MLCVVRRRLTSLDAAPVLATLECLLGAGQINDQDATQPSGEPDSDRDERHYDAHRIVHRAEAVRRDARPLPRRGRGDRRQRRDSLTSAHGGGDDGPTILNEAERHTTERMAMAEAVVAATLVASRRIEGAHHTAAL